MTKKSTYEQLEQRVKELEEEAVHLTEVEKKLCLYRTIVESSQEAIAIYDPDGNLVYINPAHEKLFGRSLEEARQLNHREYYPPESLEVLDSEVAPALARGESWKGILDVFDVDGRSFPLWEWADTVRDANGKAEFAFGLMHDVSDRKQADDALRESQQRLGLALDAGRCGMWDFNPITFGDTHYNDRWFTMLGYEPDELPHTAETWLNLLHPDDYEPVQARLQDHLEGKGDYIAEFRLKAKGGDYRWIHSVGKVVAWDSDGTPERMIGIHIDITDHREAKEALQKAHDELEQRVEERTAELVQSKKQLEEVNTALRVLLKRREEDKAELEEKVMSNMNDLVLPYIEKLKNTSLDSNQMSFVNILESNLKEIVSPFSHKLSSKYLGLTPTEIRVANLVKEGKTTKEIAEFMNSSGKTVQTHRDNIRKKIGIRHRKVNLRTYLSSLR